MTAEFHTTINIRRPQGVPLERTRGQSDDNFKIDLWNLINFKFDDALGLATTTSTDPTNFNGKNAYFVTIMDQLDNIAFKNPFITLWAYYFSIKDFEGKNLLQCSTKNIKNIYRHFHGDIVQILGGYTLENKPENISTDKYMYLLEVVLIKYIEYFRKKNDN